ncbi:hypothetical protein FVEN_g5566 [Fusarium venenatum]|nr:hypothetical protein FVEN_g5566 [Fusarium venenatum]
MADDSSSVASSVSESTQDWPLNKDDDETLIPSLADVQRTFIDGKNTWRVFLAYASTVIPGLWQANALDPYITLADVPSLPERLPRREVIYGRPCWELPLDVVGTCEDCDTNSVSLIHGRRVPFYLCTEHPIRCNVGPDAASLAMGVGSTTTNSLGVLVMC